ncbi:PLP-dependent aminotransferase family protein [Nonomuraea sp. PA05]|uniref:MocR-like pyridoxine biosynthesis transcription factor PdxR n=1 Tax=Nonomuraea sp. PA05 TaxID=2604466 RepID=UPI0011D74CA5|nr:PLP-dependent aminotransferase family protein [Nonomuraea sp. PA05]TYB51023.1 PLP-dependent aminotransferase family protein [Nonomuraea sp. PA05]
MRKLWAGSGVDLHLELPVSTGRRRALEEALRQAIGDGRLPPGTRLPSTRALAAELRLSRGTVSAAYDQLVAEGYLTTRPGSGTQVARPGAEVATTPASVSSRTPALTASRAPATRASAASRGPASPPDPAAPWDAPPPDPVPPHDLRPGQPDVSAFPARAWLRATRHVLATAPATVFGPCDPRGRIELRTALAAYLARTRGVRTTPDLIVVTTGFVQSINLLTSVVTGDGPFAMEDPGHDFYRDVVRGTGREIVPLPVDELGARTGTLTPGVAAAIVTPAHQYPTGVPLHPSRRLALREWGGLVVEDDYDGEFRYDRQPVGAFQGTAPDQVVYCGTTSESLGPAMRLGWMAVPPALIGPVTRAKLHADAHTEVLGQLVLARLIETHDYDRHVRAARLRYRRRRERLRARLSAALPGASLPGVAAGLRALLLLPPGGPAEPEVLAACERAGIALRPASPLWHGAGRDGLLIGYAAPSERNYPRALEALASTLESWEPRSRPARSSH